MRFIILLSLFLGSFSHANSENEKKVFLKILNVGQCEGRYNSTELRYQIEITTLRQNGIENMYTGAERKELGEREGYITARSKRKTEVYVAQESTDVRTSMDECTEFREKLMQIKERVQ